MDKHSLSQGLDEMMNGSGLEGNPHWTRIMALRNAQLARLNSGIIDTSFYELVSVKQSEQVEPSPSHPSFTQRSVGVGGKVARRPQNLAIPKSASSVAALDSLLNSELVRGVTVFVNKWTKKAA